MSAVDIPIMRDTAGATRPHSYPQRPQSTRACPVETDRASDAGEQSTDWDTDTSKPDDFVCQLVPAHAPASIVGRFGKARLGELDAGHVPHGHEAGTPGNGRGDLVRPVFASVVNPGMQGLDALLFAGPLCQSQFGFVLACQVGTAVDPAIRAGDLLRQAQVNADLRIAKRFSAIFNLTLEVEVPAATGILAEAPGFQRPFNGARQPQAKDPATEANGVPLNADRLIGERYPSQRALAAAPGQTAFAELPPTGGVFHADTLDGLRRQPKIMRGAFRQDT